MSCCGPLGFKASVTSKLKASYPPRVGSQLAAVDPDGGLPIDGAEMQQHAFVVPIGGNLERAAIPDVAGFLHHARQGRLDRKRDENLLAKILGRAACSAVDDRQVPQAVETLPLRADHLRPRIFGMDVLGRNVFGPARDQRASGRRPIGRAGQAGSEQTRRSEATVILAMRWAEHCWVFRGAIW